MNPTQELLWDLVRAGCISRGARRIGVYDPERLGAKAFLVFGSMRTPTWTWVDVQGNVRARKERASSKALVALARAGKALYEGQENGPMPGEWISGDVIRYRDFYRDFYFVEDAI